MKPAPEAVEAVASHLRSNFGWRHAARGFLVDDEDCHARNSEGTAKSILAFIRDAIHRDGDDADAVREALGLTWERRGCTHGFVHQVPGKPWFSSEIPCPNWHDRHVVGEWQEVQP